MRFMGLFLGLLPLMANAQDGESYLKSCASLLAMNSRSQTQFLSNTKREQARQDTISASGPNYRFRALHNLWQRDYEQAAFWLERTASLFPKEHGAVGEFYMSFLRDYPRALRHLDAHDALIPNFDEIVNHNPVSYLRGLTYRNMGDHIRALEQFSISIDPLERKHGAEWVNYRQYVSRAISYIAAQQPEKALIDLEKATKNFDRSALVHYYRGKALLQVGRTADALTAFRDASFFAKALQVQRSGDGQEDRFNLLYESEIDDVLAQLKSPTR